MFKLFYICMAAITLFISSAIAENSCHESHLIQKGDSASHIALKYLGAPVWQQGGTLDQVKSCNPSVEDINLIYPGDNLLLPQDYSQEAAVGNELNNIETDLPVAGAVPEPLVVQEKKGNVDDTQNFENETFENKINNSLYLEANSFHSELASTQTTGVGAGSKADEILSDPNLSGKIIYQYGLSEKLAVKATLDFKNYIYSEDLDAKVADRQSHVAINLGLGLAYNFSKRIALNLNLYSFEQGYYGADSLGNFIFDFERVIRLELQPEIILLNKKRFTLGASLIGTYHVGGDKVDDSAGYGAEVFANAFFDKKLRFHARYYDVSYDFVSSDTKSELLELGLGYKWNF